MKNKFIKYIVTFLTIAVLTTGCSLGGKNIRLTTGLSDSELFKIDGSAFKVSEAMVYLTTEKNLYEESYGSEIWTKSIGDITFEEYVKNSVKNRLAEIKTLNLLAKEKKIKLSNEEKEIAKNDAKEYFSGLTKEEKKYMDIDEDTVYKVYKEYRLAEKVYTELVKDVNPEISDADAKVIKVAAIYAKTYTIDSAEKRVEYTAEEKESAKKNITKLLDTINNGEDFMTIAANNTDADQVEYQFGKGDMIKEFEEVAFALKAGQVSGVIETPDGYYVIKCINDYLEDETQKNKETLIQEEKNKAFKDIYNPFVEKLSSQFNEKAWEKIEFSKMTDVKVSNFYECMD
ncbi:MAG: peptidylprolyl isomerase [Lachnospiraceae bacterium]|nr:peptidylprolyl isomerase [Lachnospiraceae bacterium]